MCGTFVRRDFSAERSPENISDVEAVPAGTADVCPMHLPASTGLLVRSVEYLTVFKGRIRIMRVYFTLGIIYRRRSTLGVYEYLLFEL